MAILTRDDLVPSPRQLWSSHPYTRNLATLIERDLREEVRLVNRPGSFGIRIRNAYHENLSDQFFSRRFFKTWLITNPYRVKSIRDAYLLAFLTLVCVAYAHLSSLSIPRPFTKSKS